MMDHMIRLLLLVVLLGGCAGGGSSDSAAIVESEPDGYIIAGQSNAAHCEWSYLEDRLGVDTAKIYYGGASIATLIERYETVPLYAERVESINAQGIIFIHGEQDSYRQKTPPLEYISSVEQYRQMISLTAGRPLTLYISTVGYRTSDDRAHYDIIRQAVIDEAEINPYWVITFNGAKDFVELGYLFDNVHFDDSGCLVMMDAFISELI